MSPAAPNDRLDPPRNGSVRLGLDATFVCLSIEIGAGGPSIPRWSGKDFRDLLAEDCRSTVIELLETTLESRSRASIRATLAVEIEVGEGVESRGRAGVSVEIHGDIARAHATREVQLDVSSVEGASAGGAALFVELVPAPQAIEIPIETAAQEALGVASLLDVALRLAGWPDEELDRAILLSLETVARWLGAARARLVARPEPRADGITVLAQWGNAAGMASRIPVEDTRWLASEMQSGRWVEAPPGRPGHAYLAIPCQPEHGECQVYLDLSWSGERGTFDSHTTSWMVRFGAMLAGLYERHCSEAARVEAGRRFELLGEHAAEGYCELDGEGRILASSPSLDRIAGRGVGDLVGVHFAEVVHPLDLPRARESLRQIFGGEEVDPVVFRVVQPGGCIRWLEAIGNATSGVDGEAILVAVMRDVSPREIERVTLMRRFELESLIAGLTRRFLGAPADDVELIINESLERIAEAMSAVRVRLISTPADSNEEPRTYQFERPDVVGRAPTLTRERLPRFAWSRAEINQNEILEIPDVNALPAEACDDRDGFVAMGISSVLAVSAVESGRVAGVLAVHGDTVVDAFPEDEKRLLRVLTELYTDALRRQRSEAELRSSEERFRALAENMRDSICEIGEDGRILYASPSYVDLLGGDQDRFLGADPLDQVHPEDRPRVSYLFRPGARSRRKGTLVFRAQSLAHGLLFLEATAREFVGQDGHARVVVAARDVTERENARQAFDRQIALETRVAELSRYFVDIEVDEIQSGIEGRLAVVAEVAEAEHSWLYSLSTSPEGFELFEWWRGEDRGDRIVPPDQSVSNFPHATRLITSGQTYHVPDIDSLPEDAVAERRDMEERGVRSILGIPIMSGGRFVGCLGFESFEREIDWSQETIVLLRVAGEIFYSTLRRRRAAQELRNSESQLRQSQKMEAVGTLAGGIAHDFNNHLAVMLTNARFVRQEVEGPVDVLEAIEDFERSADHCAQLTRSLLAFSRRSPVEVLPVDVAEVVHGVEDLVRPLLPRKIHLDVSLQAPLGRFLVDHVQVQQVLVNLIVNARDAMPEGGPLRLRAARRKMDRTEAMAEGLSIDTPYIVLSVEDSGLGMDEETQSRAFEPFFTTKDLGRGTGLGLAMAYGIVRQSDGAITFESQPGKGTMFRVYLPALED